MVEQYTNNILTTAYHDTPEREKNFHLHHALQDLVSQLGAYAARAHEILAEGQQESDE